MRTGPAHAGEAHCLNMWRQKSTYSSKASKVLIFDANQPKILHLLPRPELISPLIPFPGTFTCQPEGIGLLLVLLLLPEPGSHLLPEARPAAHLLLTFCNNTTFFSALLLTTTVTITTTISNTFNTTTTTTASDTTTTATHTATTSTTTSV